MKIAIIAKYLGLPVGFGRYSENLLGGLAKVDTENEYLVYTPHPVARKWAAGQTPRTIETARTRSRLAYWDHFTAPLAAKRDGAAVVHYFHPALPLPPIRRPVAVTAHDAINWMLPEYRLPLPYQAVIWRDLRLADRVITLSESAKRDLRRKLRLSADKITVIPNGGPAVSKTDAAKQRYLLFVGGTEKRKNLRLVIEALASLPDPLPLKVVGGYDASPVHDARHELTAILPPDRRGLVEWLGSVSEHRLQRLYRQALVLVWPSRYEGFGLPVLEAMAAGTPVISSRTSSIPEVAGRAARLVDPDDAAALAAEIRTVVGDARLRKKMTAAGRRQAGGFDWNETARHTLAVYRELAG